MYKDRGTNIRERYTVTNKGRNKLKNQRRKLSAWYNTAYEGGVIGSSSKIETDVNRKGKTKVIYF